MTNDRHAPRDCPVCGERLALISNPTPLREVYCPGGWTMAKMLELFPQTLGTMDLKNL